MAMEPHLNAGTKCGDSSPPWSWHRDALSKLRSRLLKNHDDQASEAFAKLETTPPTAGDTAADESDHDVSFALLANEEHMLQEVDAALSRIAEGTYGICEKSGKKIPLARLRAIPWTRYTKTAAEVLERQAMRCGAHPAP